jgi:hypothetical protein
VDTDLQLRVVSPQSSDTLPLPSCGTVSVGRSCRSDIAIADPLVSRHHLLFHIEDQLFVEDVGSTQGTRLRERILSKGDRVTLSPGEPVTIGSTTLIVESSPRPPSPHLWPHAPFERRLAAECHSAETTGRVFALARVSMDVRLLFLDAHFYSLSSTDAVALVALEIPPPIILGQDDPEEFELLVANQSHHEVAELMKRIRLAFRKEGVQVRTQVAWYPDQGRSAAVLLAWVRDS